MTGKPLPLLLIFLLSRGEERCAVVYGGRVLGGEFGLVGVQCYGGYTVPTRGLVHSG